MSVSFHFKQLTLGCSPAFVKEILLQLELLQPQFSHLLLHDNGRRDEQEEVQGGAEKQTRKGGLVPSYKQIWDKRAGKWAACHL